MPTIRTQTRHSRPPFWHTGIAEGQQFIDANKRTALIAMLVFLEINGWHVEASDPELADWILSFSAGAAPEAFARLLTSAMRSIG